MSSLADPGRHPMPGVVPLPHPVSAFLDSVAPSSRRVYLGALEACARLLGGGGAVSVAWHRMDARDLARLRAALEASCAPATANLRLGAVRGVLRYSFRLGMLSADALARLEVPPVRGHREPAGRALSEAEVRQLLAVPGEDARAKRDRALLAVLYGAGLRRAEAAGLTHDAVRVEDGTSLRVIGKGNAQRDVPLPPWVAGRLAQWQSPSPRWIFVGLGLDGQPSGRRLTTDGVYAIVRRRGEEAGIEVRPHDLRRTYGTLLLDGGADIATVAGLMGHARLETTRKYDRRGTRAKVAAVQSLPGGE